MNKLKKSVLNLLLKAFKLNDVSPNEHGEFNLRIPNNISSFNSKHPFYELLENVNLIAVFLDIKGRVVYCNPYLLMLTGYKLEELIGSDWFELMLKEANSETKEVFLKGLKTGEIANHFENPILSKTGKQYNIFWNKTILRDSSGTVTGTASIGEDITKRKQAENSLRISEEKFKFVFESANVGKSITLLADEFDVNQSFCDMLGYTREELQNKKWQDITPEDEILAIQKNIEPLLEGFNKSTGLVTTILDFEGNILSKLGWRQVCTEFHRENSETSRKCTISDTGING